MNKILRTVSLCAALFFCTSCFVDEGNYDYREVDQLTIENLPDPNGAPMGLLARSEHIVCNPKITSSMEGVIKDGDPNYEFVYELKGGNLQNWVRLNPSGSMNLDTLASFAAGSYTCWFKVTDLRTQCTTSHTFNIQLTSNTYEGWLVLCDHGTENRVRLDMIATISGDREAVSYDILNGGPLPPAHHAIRMAIAPSLSTASKRLYLMSREGAWRLLDEFAGYTPDFDTDASYNLRVYDFAVDPGENMVTYQTLAYSAYQQNAQFCVSENGNAYVLCGYYGAAFELPVNTSVRGGDVEYKVAPYVGVCKSRSYGSMLAGNGWSALFYDITNKRFVGWTHESMANAPQYLFPLTDPTENKKFSFTTGMDMVYMESTRYSNALVYSILQDAAGKRHIYGINMYEDGFIQESLYEDIQATDFARAEKFAFHSQYPYLFYAVGNQVYLYNLATKSTYPLNLGLKETETVNVLKFNLYEMPSPVFFSNQSEEFMGRQYELIVGSHDSAGGDTGGRVAFYKVSPSNSVTKRIEYGGFGKVRDVLYREKP